MVSRVSGKGKTGRRSCRAIPVRPDIRSGGSARLAGSTGRHRGCIPATGPACTPGEKFMRARAYCHTAADAYSDAAGLAMTRILVVDDYPPIAELIRIYIRKTCNADVDVCHSAMEAMDSIRETEYDVIISDYDMREMDGIALLRHLKQSGNQTPFILMTGIEGEEIEAEAGMLGAVYIFKGDHPTRQITEILHMIRRVVSDNRIPGDNTLVT